MKHGVFAIYGIALGVMLTSSRIDAYQDSNAASALQVQVSYTGAGSVDEKHKVYVVLWDTPEFVNGSGAMPVAIKSISSKSGAVTFSDVSKTPAYVSTVYDASGQWDAQSPPPEGSSLGLYSKTPGTPAPIDLKPESKTTIELAFDDSVKMKGGKATPQ